MCGIRKRSFIQQGVVNGDPDVDAIFRLTRTLEHNKIDIKFDETSPSIQYPLYKFTPYNSQNTLISYDAFWSLYLPKSVSFRLTDIWRSYWSQRLMWLLNGTVTYNGPNAYQLRNSHSYLNDYYQEKEMYLKTEDLIKFLFDWQCKKINFYECVLDLSAQMASKEFWSYDEVDSIKNWLQDLTQIGYKEPKLKNSYNNFNLKFTTEKLGLNYSNVIDAHFRVRYTPRFQTPIDLDTYCCQNQTNPIDLHDRLSSLEYLRKFCLLSNFSLKYENLIQTQSDITLLITFNIKIRASTIELIKHIYGRYFRQLIFCGKNISSFLNEKRGRFKRFDSFTFIDVDTGDGNFHYYCMTKAIEINFKTNGILLMSDDVLLKYWHLDKLLLNTSRIWYTKKIECSFDLVSMTKWYWWSTRVGKQAYDQLLKHLNEFESYNLFENYMKIFKSNSKSATSPQVCSKSPSDIFYVPQIKFESFHLLSSLFRYFNVFLELAVPGILSGLDSNGNMELLSGTYEWNKRDVFSSYYSYNKIGAFFHPSKLFNYNASYLGRKFCEYFLQETV